MFLISLPQRPKEHLRNKLSRQLTVAALRISGQRATPDSTGVPGHIRPAAREHAALNGLAIASGSAAAIVAVTIVAGWLPAEAAPQAKLAPCLACHGEQGHSATPNVPSLGAQRPDYTVTQLFLFREGLRIAEPMNAMTKGLGDDELRAIGDFLAALPAPPPPADQGDPQRLEKAHALIAQNRCNICHRPDLSGQDMVPRLADQRQDYLLKTLRDYKSGARHGYDAAMAEVLQSVDDAQLVEFAYYLSRLR